MNKIQSIVFYPAMLFGYIFSICRQGWKSGIAMAERKPDSMQLVSILAINKLEAIKALRNSISGLGLKEAKYICDAINQGKPFILPAHANISVLTEIFEIKRFS